MPSRLIDGHVPSQGQSNATLRCAALLIHELHWQLRVALAELQLHPATSGVSSVSSGGAFDDSCVRPVFPWIPTFVYFTQS
jgi:hypothetical protein